MIEMTPWGYEADMDNTALLTKQELVDRTGTSGERADPVIAAVTDAVRGYCGWHVMPPLSCVYRTDGDGRLVMLPAKYVSEVTSVEVGGSKLSDGQWRLMSAGRGGIIELRCPLTSWQTVTVRYVAGYGSAEMLKQAVANAAASALVTPNGVSEEHAGDVGITYANSGDASFVPSDRLLRVLSRYRLQGGV